MQFYYDFNKMMVTNPLEGITQFFINPRMIDGFKQLRLDEYSGPDTLLLDEGLPILLFPMSELKLDKGIVNIDNDGRNGHIKVGDSLKIYFNFHHRNHLIRINTVIGYKPRKFDSTTIRAVTKEDIKSIIKDIDEMLF